MLNWLPFRAGASRRPPPPSGPVAAIGDIHGRRDLLVRLLNKIRNEIRGERCELIFLGDYIDRGADSRGVLDILVDLSEDDEFETVFLKGNHEATMLDFLSSPDVGPSWAQFGGDETLLSYGVRPPLRKNDKAGWHEARDALVRNLPDTHLDFLRGLDLSAERGCYLFVHAGVDPDRPLDEQDESSLLWIRDAFLEDRRRLPRIVVHGHTPEPEAHADGRRIGLDTGAYQTGILTACLIRGSETRFISTA